MARIVVPEYPHYVTQRAVRSLPIFRVDEDWQSYLESMGRETQRFGRELGLVFNDKPDG